MTALPSKRVGARPGLAYEAAAVILVPIFANSFALWGGLVKILGLAGANIAPIGAALLAAAAALFIALRRCGGAHAAQPGPVIFGAAVLIAALFLSDSEFPAKRIHVLEYGVLALVVGAALRFHLRGGALFAAIVGVTAILGGHDEMLQGLHPDRTFGLRDIAIDAVSGVGGALVWLGLWGRSAAEPRLEPAAGDAPTAAEWAALAAVAVGWALLLLATPSFRGEAAPLWPTAPLAAGGVALILTLPPAARFAGMRRVMLQAEFLMLATLAYPVISHAFALALR